MPLRSSGRLVYSTGSGRICPGCSQPTASCGCAGAAKAAVPVPAKAVAKLRLDTRGRGGKSVTVVGGLPCDPAFLDELARELKRALGTGGAVIDGAVELQGDVRARLRELLAARGLRVKG